MSYIERVWFVYIYNGVRIRGRAAVQCEVSSFQATKLFFFLLGALQRNEFVVVTRNAAKG